MRFHRPRVGGSDALDYTLFDAAVLLIIIPALWYVFSEPSETTTLALSGTLSHIVEPRVWGWVLMFVGVDALLMSFGDRLAVMIGYVLVACSSAGWAASLLIGVAVAHPPWDDAAKSIGVAVWFAALSSRMVRDVWFASREHDPQRATE